jgi:hypothetical protein
MAKSKDLNSKTQSMIDNSNNSLDSRTGYKDTGNPAQVHAKARVVRNNGNGSHH